MAKSTAVEIERKSGTMFGREMVSYPVARTAGGLGISAGIALLCWGLFVLFSGEAAMPAAIAFTAVGVLDIVLPALAVLKNRVAWAFTLSLNGTLFFIFLFGSPQVRDGLSARFETDINIGIALLPAMAFGLITAFFAIASDEY